MTLLSVIGLFVVCTLPVLGWAYMVTYFDDRRSLQGGHLLGGLIGGIVTGGTIVGLSRYTDYQESGFVLIAIGSLLVLALLQSTLRKNLIRYLKEYNRLIIYVILVTGLLWLVRRGYVGVSTAIMSALLLAGIEEIGKALHVPTYAKDVSDIVLTGVYVALGFALIENILYLWNEWNTATYIGRQILSTPLHIIAATIVLSGLVISKKQILVGVFLILGISYHALYNIMIYQDNLLLAFFVLAGGYMIVGKLTSIPREI